MTTKDFKIGTVFKIDGEGYFRTVAVEQDIYAKRCEEKSPYNFKDDDCTYLIDLNIYKDDIEIVTWYAAGYVESFLKGKRMFA